MNSLRLLDLGLLVVAGFYPHEGLGAAGKRERVLFIGTRFSNLYTSVDIWPCCREDQPGPLCGALCGVSRRRRCVNRLLPPAILSRHQSTRRRYLLRCLRMQTDPIVLGLLGATRIKSVRTRFIQFGFVQFRSALCDPRSSSTLMIRQTSVPMSSGWLTFLEARTWICCTNSEALPSADRFPVMYEQRSESSTRQCIGSGQYTRGPICRQ